MIEKKTLLEVRVSKAITQSELAYKSGVSIRTLWAIEHGTRRPIRAVQVQIAAALGVPVETIAWPERNGKP